MPPGKASEPNVASVMGSLTPAELESHARRVSKEDLAKVTPEDIRDALAHMSPDQYKAALRAMADYNKYGDVVNHTNPAVFESAMNGIDDAQLADAAMVLSTHAAFQGSVLANMTNDHKAMCQKRLSQRQNETGRR